MNTLRHAVVTFRITQVKNFPSVYQTCCMKYSTVEEPSEPYTLLKQKVIHPYKNIHPWKSENEFAKDLVKNVIYNSDGIVAINKPYGISVKSNYGDNTKRNNAKTVHKIVGALDYSVQNVLPYIVKELDVPRLIPCTGSEKFMTGVYIFGINNDICDKINHAIVRANHFNKFRKYWLITTRVPNLIEGSHHIGMTMKQSPSGNKKVILLSQWSKNAMKRNEVKILNVNYKVLSNSTQNLSSLIEMNASTKKWHCIRLFASTMLYSPVLGDNYHGSRIQELMGTWVKVNPFADSCWDLPKINSELLGLLNIRYKEQEIIPAHIHLRSATLASFGKQKEDVILEAPLMPPFDWTCKQLMFKNIPYEQNDEDVENKKRITYV